MTFQGDKSIAHRLVLSSLVFRRNIRIRNLPDGKDVATSLEIVQKLGVKACAEDSSIVLSSVSLPYSFPEDFITLDCKNSGTTARLLCGILTNLNGRFRLVGDESLSKRPMERVVRPLADLMNVDIRSTDGHLPVLINAAAQAKAAEFENVTGSAQVKSAVLFAGLASSGRTSVKEATTSRDHTERLLAYIAKNRDKKELDFDIPGDISSAAYFAVFAAITGKKVCLKNVLLNPTRTGFLNVLKRMGANIEEKLVSDTWEPIGDLIVCGGNLMATDIKLEEIPSLIDELPILAIAMCFANGKSTVSGASELRVKESDRIGCLISQLRKVGVDCSEKSDGYEITGGGHFKIAELDSFKDHRLAMSFAIFAKCAGLQINIKGRESTDISFPEFWLYL